MQLQKKHAKNKKHEKKITRINNANKYIAKIIL